jgi:hypothetical protein
MDAAKVRALIQEIRQHAQSCASGISLPANDLCVLCDQLDQAIWPEQDLWLASKTSGAPCAHTFSWPFFVQMPGGYLKPLSPPYCTTCAACGPPLTSTFVATTRVAETDGR